MDQIHIRRTPGLARHTDNAEAIWSGVRTFCTLTVIGARVLARNGNRARRINHGGDQLRPLLHRRHAV